jgi:hypothetical protein
MPKKGAGEYITRMPMGPPVTECPVGGDQAGKFAECKGDERQMYAPCVPQRGVADGHGKEARTGHGQRNGHPEVQPEAVDEERRGVCTESVKGCV